MLHPHYNIRPAGINAAADVITYYYYYYYEHNTNHLVLLRPTRSKGALYALHPNELISCQHDHDHFHTLTSP